MSENTNECVIDRRKTHIHETELRNRVFSA